VLHVHQGLLHVQTQLRRALMDEFEICFSFSCWQREHDSPSLFEILAQRVQVVQERLCQDGRPSLTLSV
jgi:hypothetical protein